eukprot:gene7048-9026_t
MEPRDSRITYLGQPIILERDNWPQFKDAVRTFALKLGDAGMALRSGREVKERPVAPTAPAVTGTRGSLASGEALRYEMEKKEFDEQTKEFESYRRQKEITYKLESQAGFEDLINAGDVIGFFKLVETVVQGVGTVSIYHLTTKFFSLRMTNGEQWASYFREWREVVAGLLKQGDPDKILDAILRTHLVTSVDQQYFKEMLTPIY